MQKYKEPKKYMKGPDTVIDSILVLMFLNYPDIKNYKITDIYDNITINKWIDGKLTFNEFLIIFKENEQLYEKKEDSYILNEEGLNQAMKVIYY
jgi:hypothetical protein